MTSNKLLLPSIAYMKQLANSTPPKSIRVWGRRIGEFYNNTCIVTGLSQTEVPVEKHHIYNVFDYPNLKLCLFNGIILTRELHLMFHRLYGNKVNADDLLDFLRILKNTKYNQNSSRLFEASIWVSQLKQVIETDYKK